MLTPEQRREIAALALLAAALFVLLALAPVSWLGARGEVWFPSGSVAGRVGAWLRGGLLEHVGLSAVLLPLLIGIAGLALAGWMDRGRALRWGAFTAGLLAIVPTTLHLARASDPLPGGVGRALGEPLSDAVGWVGALLVLAAGFTVLSVATLGWNPLRPLFRAADTTVRAVGGALRAGIERGVAAGIGWLGGRGRDSGRGRRSEAGAETPEVGVSENGPSRRASVEALPEPSEGGDGALPMGPLPEVPADGSSLPDPTDPRELAQGTLPPMDLLEPADPGDPAAMTRELDELGEVLVQKLGTFNVKSDVVGRTTGPVVTQYELVPAPGIKVNRIANLEADLALAMKARTIRIVAPIPGKGAVGVEIPNPRPQVVRVREILESEAYRRSRAQLPLTLGKDLEGAPYVADLARMPHCLIAGATGSGKSVALNTIITSLIYRHTPEDLRLLLIDPKMVELSTYADLPHLRHPVVTDPRDAAGVLKWAVLEMERRYALLSANGVRSLGEFNERVREGHELRRAEPEGPAEEPESWLYQEGILPYIVLVVDELADLMMTVQAEVEKPLTHLAQKARAIGIHLVVATQRPSVNVITGLIKANFPCRMAFRVASKTDSRTILDQNGADALVGNGDMLFLPPGRSAPVRIQGAFMSTEETERLVGWFKERRERVAAGEEETPLPVPDQEEDILQVIREQEAEEVGDEGGGERDELFREAAEVCIRNEQGSTSLLQRRLRIGYGRAARVVDQLHEAGVLGPPDGSKPREVLVGMEELDEILGP